MPPSSATLNLESLLQPLPGEKPCGENLRWEPVWDEISQYRKSWTDPLDSSANKLPEWSKVIDVTNGILTSRSKDFLIAGWLTEALVREEGFAGFRDGLRLIRGLVAGFWDQSFPLIEDGDLSNRAAPFIWLTSHDGGARMPAALREIPLAPSATGQNLNWNYWHLRRAAPQGKDEKEDSFKRRNAEAENCKQVFDAAVDTSPIVFYQTLLTDIDECLTEIDQLAAALDQLLGDQSANWGELRKSIGEIRVFVYGVLKRRGGLIDVTETNPAGEEGAVTTFESVNGSSENGVGPIRSRADAIARLELAAKFFSETEPHSPVAYLVRRAVRWAGMPFEEVIGELVKDDKLVKQIGETLGIVSGPPPK